MIHTFIHQRQLDRLRLEESNPAFQAIYAKSKGQTGELALLFNLLIAAIECDAQPSEFISRATMQRAIDLQKIFIGQWKLIHSMGGEDRGEVNSVLSRIINLSTRKGWLSVRDIQSSSSAFRKFKADNIRQLFYRLVEMGRGQIEGTGAKIRFRVSAVTVSDSAVDRQQLTATAPDKGLGDSAVVTAADTAVNCDSRQNTDLSRDAGEFAVAAVAAVREDSDRIVTGDTVIYDSEAWVVDLIEPDGRLNLSLESGGKVVLAARNEVSKQSIIQNLPNQNYGSRKPQSNGPRNPDRTALTSGNSRS